MPDPADYDNQDDFISACVSMRQDEHPEEDNDQSVAVCFSMWENKSMSAKIVHKTFISDSINKDDENKEFIFSDLTPDRYDDTINPDGWVTDNFKKNPIALFNHNPDAPIGKWVDVHVKDGALRGRLQLAPKGTSPRIDEMRALLSAGILNGCSVGFIPIESRPRAESKKGGLAYIRQELMECSVVSIPANPSALAVAKSLRISDETMKLVFGKHAKETIINRGVGHGEHASTTPVRGNRTMSTPLVKRIEDAQTRVASLREQLAAHLETVNDETPDDGATTITEELSNRIAVQEKSLEALKRAEAQLAQASTPAAGGGVPAVTERGSEQPMLLRTGNRPFAMPTKKIKGGDYLWRSAAMLFKQYCSRNTMSMDDILRQEAYGEEEAVITKTAIDMITRSNTVPATTTTVNWAKELAQTMYADLLEALQPVSIYPKLRQMGQSYTFGRNATISIPSRDSTPTVGGAFVLQGNPIPVKQGSFTAVTLTLQKMGVIVPMTREIAEHSTPALEGIIRTAILDDTAVALDTVLMGAAAGSATQPVGMLYTVTAITANSAGATPLAKFQADVQAIVSALVTATNGNLRRPVWIISPSDKIVIGMLTTTTGDQPYRDEISRDTLFNIPVITSASMGSDRIILLDAADFATATGDAPRFDVSDQAVLHMDTAPTALSGNATATPVAAAYPIRSLYQTDSIAVRMIMDLTWTFLRSNSTVAWVTTPGWN